MFLMRSWVIGRGGEIFSSSRAMASASKSPTQMGSERFSSSSRRMITGMLESGSSASPLTFISSHMVRLLVLAGISDMKGMSRALLNLRTEFLEDLDHAPLHHLVGRQPVDALAAELDGALGDVPPLGAEEAGDGLQRRGLAGASTLLRLSITMSHRRG